MMAHIADFPGPLLIDAHVHLHGGQDPARLLDTALAHADRAGSAAGTGVGTPGLILTDMAGQDGFTRLHAGALPVQGWRLSPLDEVTVLAERSHHRLLLLAGAQMATAEGMEVLSLLSTARIPDRLPLRDTLARVRASGGLPVIPWGFGKWTFGRRRLLRAVLDDPGGLLFLGDSGGRPWFWREEGLFAAAAAAGIPDLPGSDPLPLSVAGEAERAGSRGFMLPDGLPAAAPGLSLRRRLATLDGQPARFGGPRPALSFMLAQAALRLPPLRTGSQMIARAERDSKLLHPEHH